MKCSFFCLIFLVFIGFTTGASADVGDVPESKSHQAETESKNQRISTLFSGEFETLKNSNGSSLTAYALGVTGIYGLSRNWGLSLKIAEGFSSSGFSALFTSWGAYVTYAVTGSHIISHEKTGIGEWSVVRATEEPPTGVKLFLGLGQTIFSGASNSVTFTGLEAGARYEFPSSAGRHFFLGAGLKQIGNGVNTISSVSFSGGLLLWW